MKRVKIEIKNISSKASPNLLKIIKSEHELSFLGERKIVRLDFKMCLHAIYKRRAQNIKQKGWKYRDKRTQSSTAWQGAGPV